MRTGEKVTTDMRDEIDALVDWQLAQGEARGRRRPAIPTSKHLMPQHI